MRIWCTLSITRMRIVCRKEEWMTKTRVNQAYDNYFSTLSLSDACPFWLILAETKNQSKHSFYGVFHFILKPEFTDLEDWIFFNYISTYITNWSERELMLLFLLKSLPEEGKVPWEISLNALSNRVVARRFRMTIKVKHIDTLKKWENTRAGRTIVVQLKRWKLD